MLTQFGEVIRRIRRQHGLLLKEMAEALEVRSAFLSAVEYGRKSIPDAFLDKLFASFAFTKDEKADLIRAIVLERDRLEIRGFSKLERYQQEVAIQFPQELPGLSEEKAERLMEILRCEDDEPYG